MAAVAAVAAVVAAPATAAHASVGGTITYQGTIGGQQGEAIVYPSGVAVDAGGNVYVADTGNYNVEKWAQGTGSPDPPQWSEGVRGAPSVVGGQTSFQAPRDVAVDPVVSTTQEVYVADTDDSSVQVLDASTGQYLHTVTTFGSGKRFSDPIGINVGTDPLGNEIIMVSDGHTGNVYVFDTSFTLRRTIPPTAATEGTRDASTDAGGNIYTADYRGGKIDMYTPQNTTATPNLSWGGVKKSADCHNLAHPYGIDIDTADTPNRVYVASSDLEQIKVFDTSGNCLSVGTTTSNAIGSKTTTSTDATKLFQLRRVAVGAGPDPPIYAADLWGLKVLTYSSSDGTIDTAQPEIGDGQYPPPGNLNEPHSLAIDATDGRLFVTNTVNQRIDSFDFNGNNPQAWGVKGTQESTTSFNWAQGISYNQFNGMIWVANTRNNRIDEFTPDGATKVASFPPVTRLSSVFNWPMAITFGPTLSPTGSSTDSTMYVADTYHNKLVAFAVSGTTVGSTPLWTTATTLLKKPFSLVYDTTQSPARLVVADTFNSRIVSLDPASGTLNQNGVLVASAGSAPGSLYRPEGVTVDSTGNIWVADTGNNRVEEFNAAGAYADAIGSYGTTGDSSLNAPQGLGFDPLGLLYVADVNNNRIQVFTVS